MSKLAKLGAVLDKDNWEWLQGQNEEIANAVADEVRDGVDPASIGRFVTQHIGPDRSAFVARVVSAARHCAGNKNR